MLSNVQFITADDGSQYVIAISYAPEPLLAPDSHPNFKAIGQKWLDGDAEGFADLFDIPASITSAFSRLSEQVTVKDDTIYFDGDPVHGVVEQAILDTLSAGEDVGAIVNFYEKLNTNPLGDVKEGVYTFLASQGQKSGGFTLTPEGNILGYKSVQAQTPEWREGYDTVYVPSRRGEGIVNGREVGGGEYIETVVGDTVEMPRSRVLHDLSRACGDGLHVGTFSYASTFSGDTVQLVEFSPRDIVSYPDNYADFKLRVCRYKVVDIVTEALDTPVWHAPDVEPDDLSNERYDEDDDLDLDADVDEAQAEYDDAESEASEAEDYLDSLYSARADAEEISDAQDDLRAAERRVDEASDRLDEALTAKRNHGRGGATSQAAKGRGRNPAQDNLGRFSGGRPGSDRDTSTGRFV
jgi:hypothetical protein